MKVIGHSKNELCPSCGENAFCDDCAICSQCHWAPPIVDLPHPPAPLPLLKCDCCGHTQHHSRNCIVTKNSLTN